MLCEKCKIREANIKYTEIINGVKKEHNLCTRCAKEMDFGQYTAMLDGELPIGKLLSGLLGLEDDEEDTDIRGKVVCPTCGTTFDDFVANSQFGCPDCYGVFDLFINDKIKQIQGSEKHRGKQPRYNDKPERAGTDSRKCVVGPDGPERREGGESPAKCTAVREAARQLRSLEHQLKDALKQEDYELAAKCRDEIKELKAGNNREAETDE
jgi:protein arginine kinase activator